MKILINRQVVHGPWGGGNKFVKSFYELGSQHEHEIVNQFFDDIDVIFIQDPRPSELGISINEILAYKQSFPNVKIVQRINECDARKNTDFMDQLLNQCSQHIDFTVFVSNWIKGYHLDKGWACKNNAVIYNGVDRDIFKPNKKLDNGKINIVAHHWSSNQMKGFDVYDKIDEFVGENDNFTFTYIGRENGTFKNTKVVRPLFGEALGRELGRYDLYISASKYDPGPNHILESLACKLPTYVHENGGGCVEFAGENMCFTNFEQLLNIIFSKKYENNTLDPDSWEDCLDAYFEIIEEI